MLVHPCRPSVRWGTLAAVGLLGLAAAGCGQPSGRDDAWIAEEICKNLRASSQAAVPPKEAADRSKAAAPGKPSAAPGAGEVTLSLLDALHRALANNHDIQIAGYQPPIANQDVAAAEAIFDPAFFLSNTAGRVDRPVQSILDTGATQADVLVQDTWSWQTGLRSKIPTGGTLALYQASDFQETNSRFTVPNPQYATRFAMELAQPLLRSGGIEYNRAAIRVANLNASVSYQDFRKAVSDVVAAVVNAYWQLVFDLESLRVSRASHDLAAEVLRRETARQALGVSSEVDLSRAQAAVALRRADMVRAENQTRDSMDRVKLLLNAPDLPLALDARVRPTDPPRFYVADVNRTEAIATALARRPDLERARTALAINRIRVDAADHERLPKLDATLRYTMNGLGSTLVQGLEQQDPGERITWSAGLEFELPLGNRAAEATRRKRLLEFDQSLVELDRLAAQATQEVNAAARAVLLARDEVEAALQAKTAADRMVRGEQRRFELGQTTNDDVLRAQETLAQAERDYIKALLNFNLALVSLERAKGTLLETQGVEVFQPEAPADHPRPLGLRPAAGAAK
jgi:outer membrane protein TolC